MKKAVAVVSSVRETLNGYALARGRMYEFDHTGFIIDFNHHSHMAHGLASATAAEEHEVAHFHLRQTYSLALKSLRPGTRINRKAEVSEHKAGETRAVKSLGSLSATAIAYSQIILGKRYELIFERLISAGPTQIIYRLTKQLFK